MLNLDEHRSALRGTPRFGFAKVPKVLNLGFSLLKQFEVALGLVSWRVKLNYSRGNAPSPLRLACCARGRVVLYRCQGRPPKSFSLSLSLCYSQTFQHSAICMRRRIMPPYSKIHRRATLRACGA
jgi:hypothetical protein